MIFKSHYKLCVATVVMAASAGKFHTVWVLPRVIDELH